MRASVAVRRRSASVVAALVASFILPLSLIAQGTSNPAGSAQSQSYGVYVQLVEAAPGSFDDVAESVRAGLEGAGWELLAEYNAGVDEKKCAFKARVFVVHSPEFAAEVLSFGPRAAFALPLRVAVYEDENGVHVAAVNPQSITRTVISETAFAGQSAAMVRALEEALNTEFTGDVSAEQFGQMRDRGLIGKTMGIIAGGPFEGKVEKIASVSADDETLESVAEKVYAGLQKLAGNDRWETRPVYMLDLSEDDVVILGVTGAPVEYKSFNIVGAGTDDSRKDLACPGLAHAAAYPIEIVIAREDDRINVLVIDEMFRMKMYFEDAGKMKFAANMKMPGSIENEIRDKVEESLY